MTYLEAALHILGVVQRPMTAREITERALTEKLIIPRGKTPQATMSAVLYRNAQPDGCVVKLAIPANLRAARGSVRWTLQTMRPPADTQLGR